VYVHFQIQRLKNKLTSVEKELQQAKMDNVALAHYINDIRKKDEDRRKEKARKKAEEDAHKKAAEGQISKDV
jgi:hypothetical protein